MADNFLLKLKPDQKRRLINQIVTDYTDAAAAHNERIKRAREYVRRFYRLEDADGRYSKIALIQEQVLTKVAREYTALFGQGAEVVADPRGQQDSRTAAKVGAMLTYKFLSAMKPQRALLQFIFQRNLLGRAIAYMPYEIKSYQTLDLGKVTEQEYYRGPCLYPLAADDIITAPIKHVQSIQDFPFIIHQQRVQMSQVLRNVKAGKYYQLTEQEMASLRSEADGQSESADEHDPITQMETAAEGILYGMSAGRAGRGRLRSHVYYGYFEDDEIEADEIVARIEPNTQTLLSVHRLIDLYPKLVKRRPYVDGALMPIGGYWSMGLAQALTMDEEELNAAMDMFDDGGEGSVFPPIAVDPSAGVKADSIRLGPRRVIEVKNAAGIQQIQVRFDPQYMILKDQFVRASVERRFGISDYIQGRDAARPTAPDTAAGQAMLMQAGNERLSLDTSILSLDITDMLERVYMLESTMGDENEWYRVTEEKAGDIVGARNGKFQLTEAERHGFYDFTIRLANGPAEQEARRQRIMAVYELALTNPILATNPLAMWNVTAKAYRELLNENLAEIVPKPPDPGFSAAPGDEWTKMLQGQNVPVHPMDDDNMHLQQHMADLEEHAEGGRTDEKAMALLQEHMADHIKQQNQKRLMQAMIEGITRNLAGNNQQTGGLTFRPPVALPVQQLGEQMQTLIAPPAEAQSQGQPGAMPQ